MDRRKKKTIDRIETVFLQLLSQKELSKITVTEITNLADIGRGTFYLHYQDVYDLHQQIGEALIQDILMIVQEKLIKEEVLNYKQMFLAIFDCLTQQSFIVELYSRPDSSYPLMEHLNKTILALFIAEMPEYHKDTSSYNESLFMISGTLAVMEKALKMQNDFTEIINQLDSLLMLFEKK